jgi:hypothetical protein
MMLSRHILLDLPFHNPASWVRKVHDVGPLGNAHSGAAYRVALENAGNLFLSDPEHRRRLTLCKCHYAGDFSLIALLGLYWLLNLNYLDYLLMKVDFSFSITTNPPSVLFTLSGYYYFIFINDTLFALVPYF